MLEYGWPRTFTGREPQPVNAAMFYIAAGRPRLVACWTFSPTGDETSVYFLKPHRKVVWDAGEKRDQGMTPGGFEDALSVSSGDYATTALYCPALEEGLKLSDLQ